MFSHPPDAHGIKAACGVEPLRDAGGIMAQEMCELFGLQQIADFPTRGDNTLDLVMTAGAGIAKPKPGPGTNL